MFAFVRFEAASEPLGMGEKFQECEGPPHPGNTSRVSSRTISPEDPKDVLSGRPQKAMSDTAERVRELRFVNAEKWVLAWKSIVSKLFGGIWEYVGASLREVT